MWIRSVTAHAFGAITEKTLCFHDGLNIVIGANGTGKSTWHGAIYAALYGLPPANTSAVDGRLARRRPRSGHGWSVSSRLVLDDLREIEIAQNLLEPSDSTAIEANTRVDVSEEIRQPDGGLDGTPWLGLDRRSFAATAWMEQAYGLLALPEDTSGRALRRAIATGAGADAVPPAIDRVTRHRQRVVGDATDVHSPYGQAVARLHAAETARAQVRSLADRRGPAQSTVDSAERHVADVEQRLNAAKLAQAEEDLRRLEFQLGEARWELYGGTAAAPAPFDPAVAEAEQEYDDALAALTELEAGAAPIDGARPAIWRDEGLRWYLAGVVLVVGLVVFGASANTDFRPGIAGGGVTTGAALALGAWTALVAGRRRVGNEDSEATTAMSAQRQVVNECTATLRDALEATGFVVHANEDVAVAFERYRNRAESHIAEAQNADDLTQRVIQAGRRVDELQKLTVPTYGSPFGSATLYGAPSPSGFAYGIPATHQSPPSTVEELQADLDRAAAAAAEAVQAFEDIETAVSVVAPKAATYGAAWAEYDRLRRIDTVLATTVSRLEAASAAVHHNAAAELEFHLRDWMCDVTGGRYTSVRIDPESLDVFIAGPDDPEVEAFEDSHGTSELVRLLLRLALFLRARGSERGPLVLDDVLAHMDPERAAAMVDVLAKIAKHKHQVILFTTHEVAPGMEVARLTGTRDDPISS